MLNLISERVKSPARRRVGYQMFVCVSAGCRETLSTSALTGGLLCCRRLFLILSEEFQSEASDLQLQQQRAQQLMMDEC